MKRAGRLLVSLTLVALLVAACAWGARAYLTSRHAANKVAAQIAAFYGGPLQLDSVDIGMGGSSVRGLRLFEAEGEEYEPWLTVESARADLSAWDLLGDDPIPVVGHSKGGLLLMQLCVARPELVSHLVNIDGLPSPRAAVKYMLESWSSE